MVAKLKIATVAIVAAFSISVMTTASASAACGGGLGEWCIGESPLIGSAELTGESNVIENFVMGAPVPKFKIECSIVGGKKGLLESPNKGSAESLTFEGCTTIEGAPTCELEGTKIPVKPIEIESGSLKRSGEKEIEAILKPVLGSFANIKIKTGKGCPISGTQAVTGKVKIRGPAGQEGKVEQELDVNTEAGELKVGGDEAAMKGKTKVRLKSGSAFSFR